MKVAVFCSLNNPTKLEEDINNWLANINIEIIKMKTAVADHWTTVIILYKDVM